MCDDYTNHLLECILDRLESDEYEQGPIKTVGGAGSGNYVLRSPYNTECEWMPYAAYLTLASQNGVSEQATIIATLTSAARATFSQQYSVAAQVSLSLIFNVTALTGGTTPTVTFRVSTVGADGTVTQLEQAAAISAAGVFLYSIGPGTDAKEFGATIQVDMITTGAPTSITFSGSIIGKGPVLANSGGYVYIAQDPSISQLTFSGPTLGLLSQGQESTNALDGLVIPTNQSQGFNPPEHWQPLGRGAVLYVTVAAPQFNTAALTYVQIAFRRKIEKYIPQMERMYPKTHSSPQSRRALRQLPAASNFAAGFESQYPDLSGSEGKEHIPYRHEQINEQDDTRNVGNVIRRVARYGR